MSFFDEIGKKITDAGRSAAEKAKDLAEITHLNSIIKENEAKTDSLFAELGESYFRSHRNDSDAEFNEKIRELDELLKQTEEYRGDVLELKGLVKCPYCGAEVPTEETECPECGKKIPRKAETETGDDGEDRLICSVCGYRMRPGSNFCIMCGTPVKKEAKAEAVSAPSTKAEAVPTPSTKAEADTSVQAISATSRASLNAQPDAEQKPLNRASANESTKRTAAPVEFAAFEEQPEAIEADNEDGELDDIAAKAAAAISKITAEKLAARKAQTDISLGAVTEELPSEKTPDTNTATTELPDFDAIDDGLVVEEQILSDSPTEEKNEVPRNTVSRPSIGGHRCTKCGALMPDGAVYCTKCGARCDNTESIPPVCPGCGAFVSSGMVFCPECGMKLI